MPPIVKESEVLTATPGTATAAPSTASTLSESSPARPQPVALEVPITINGARTVDGSEKREPFSESTKTVLVLSNGAVIRLASSVAPGQLLFLTNEKTKKEVVCQVVKSKNYRNVSGYVELEFTEPVIGFWGMRFPNDRIGPAPVPSVPVPAVSPLPAPPAPAKTALPAAGVIPEPVKAPSSAPKPVESPVAADKPAEPKPIEASVRPPDVLAPVAVKSEVPPAPVFVAPMVVPPLPPPASAAPPAITMPAPGSAEALKLENARLLEQLSALSFSGAPAEKAAQTPAAPPVIEQKEASQAAASKIIEFAAAETESPKPAPVAKNISPVPMPSLDEESLKIPAWLEPLARNTVAPSSTQELIEREKARRTSEKPEISEPVIAPVTVAEVADVPELRVPSFGDELVFDEKKSARKSSTGSNKGAMVGAVAAGLLLLAGGAWYLRQQGDSAKNAVASVAAPVASVAAGVLPAQHQPVATAPATSLSNLGTAPAASSSAVNSQPQTQPPKLHDASASSVTPNAAVVPKSSQTPPVQHQTRVVEEQPRVVPQEDQPQLVEKKPGLGEIHLASPKINRKTASQDSATAEAAPVLNEGQIAPGGDSMSGGLVAGNMKQPSAPAEPLPIGGDVKPARLISSVPPVVSSVARSQHASGDVKIDALIDANGRVTSMKIISGPAILRQSAMDALRQWKYQPATLDGNPVPMHLTVTLQFRLQ